ncbi:MAG: PIN domain-containing protein [Chthoniobacterales bacterium]
MDKMIDSCVWIDLFSAKASTAARAISRHAVAAKEAVLCEPIQFEVLRGCPSKARRELRRSMETMPMLATPHDLWRRALALGETCYDHRLVINSLDLLIAALCLHHEVSLVTFDVHFRKLAEWSKLKVEILKRPGSAG